MKGNIHSYPSIYALGHGAISELFFDPIIVEEKVDGSQFSFMKKGNEFFARSKGQELFPGNVPKMFQAAYYNMLSLPLHDDWVYRGEVLDKPKHNSISYDRIPKMNVILFDINRGPENYLSYDEKVSEAMRLGLEVVPILFHGTIESPASLKVLLDTVSILGGQKIEGFVVKNYTRFGRDKKALMGKYVSEAFKEVHGANWKRENPGRKDVLDELISQLKTPARWNKAVQHLKERGVLAGEPKDIGPLIKEVQEDTHKECEEMIKDRLMSWAWPRLKGAIIGGLPQWYKEQLMEKQFGKEEK